jgi:MarR family 2-MHQ and catechol resistance regulon transcriptional repressor
MKYRGEKKERLALSTYVKLVRAAETVLAKATCHLKKVNLTVSQFGVLEALYHLGPMCQRDLAKKILKSTANLTTVIDNLEKRQLVTRERDIDDRRYFNILLTEEGDQLMREIFPDHADRISGAMNILTSSEQMQLGMLCKKLSGKV